MYVALFGAGYIAAIYMIAVLSPTVAASLVLGSLIGSALTWGAVR